MISYDDRGAHVPLPLFVLALPRGIRFWVRMQETAGPGCQQRLMSTLDTYFQAIMQQADDRGSENIPELEEYILLRRDTSGCKTGFAFIEYAARIDLPDDVVEHPIIKALADATNDLVSWANVSAELLGAKA